MLNFLIYGLSTTPRYVHLDFCLSYIDTIRFNFESQRQ